MTHRCSHCYVAQYGMKSDVPCKNEWAQWLDYQMIRARFTNAS